MSPEEAIQVDVRKGRMEAFLSIKGGADLDYLNAEACKAMVRAEGILLTTSVVRNIEELVEKYYASPAEDIEELIAEGNSPKPGDDGYLEWVPGYDPTEGVHPVIATGEAVVEGEEGDALEGRVNYYEATVYKMASEGDHIATICAPTAGCDGTGVDGAVIPAVGGKTYSVHTDQSVNILDDGKVIARQSGLISFDGNNLRILDVLDIPGYVDFGTGNIEFEGDIVVQKGIRDRFRVTCSGSLTVHGMIEAAHVNVGQDAVFSRGMAGREKGTIEVHGNLRTRYLEGVSGRVYKDIRAEKEIVNCSLVIGKSLEITGGSLIGGCTRVGQLVELDVVGSQIGIPTMVSVGDIPELTDAYLRIEELLSPVEERFNAAKDSFEMLNSVGGQLSSLQREQLTEAQFEMSEWGRRHSEMLAKQETIMKFLKEHAQPTLVVNKRLHSDSIVIMRGQGVKITTDIKGPVQIDLDDDGDAVVTDLTDQTSVPLVTVGDAVEARKAILLAEESYGQNVAEAA